MKQAWRLKKTLARKVDFRPIERDDVKYAYVAYKKGLLASMGEKWAGGEMEPAKFATEFEAEVGAVYHGAWTLMAEGRKGYMPCGIVLGFYSHPLPQFAPFMIVGDIIWFPWATARNRIESAVNFFSRIRSQIPMVEYANEQNRPFFDMICKHGIMNRVGTMQNVYPGEKTAVYETRSPERAA